MLQAIASWLESPDNEAMMLAEYDDTCLQVVAQSCVTAAQELRKAAEEVDALEPQQFSGVLTPEAIDELALLADALDSSDDERLKKQASVLDELLLTVAADAEALSSRQSLIDSQIDEAKKKYLKEPVVKVNPDAKKIADAEKAIEQSGMTKEYRVLEHPLQSRSCPDHPGTPISRVADNTWQCPMDGKVYDFKLGFTLENGDKVPGSSVENQSLLDTRPQFSAFETREGRLSGGR